jgi:hypothetical protein
MAEMLIESRSEPVEPGARGVAAHAGIDDAPAGVQVVESLLQQCDPALLLVDTIGRTDAVAQDQDCLPGETRGRDDGCQKQNE